MIKLDDKLYTSTEVADILGVSLRSVYRYIEENKLIPEVKTATGRHRFTKQNIVDFLYPNGEESSSEIARAPKPIVKEKQPKQPSSREVGETVEPAQAVSSTTSTTQKNAVSESFATESEVEPVSEPIDWLAKFREAAKKFEETTPAASSAKDSDEPALVEKETFTGFASANESENSETEERYYYRSRLGGLKDIAQNIDKTSRNSGLDYAFTLNAGLSLYKAIKPFSILHAYVRSKDKDFYERVLMLTPSDENNAQLCLIVSDVATIYANRDELHGLYVVDKNQLSTDVRVSGDDSLVDEAQSIIG